MEPVPQVVHGPALPPSVRGRAVVADSQQLLHAAGGHAQQRGDPHPEHRPRAAQIDGRRHPGDTAGADGGGQGGAQGLEGGDPPDRTVPGVEQGAQSGGQPQPDPEQGEKAAAQRQQQPGKEKETQQPGVPQGVGRAGEERQAYHLQTEPGPVRRTGPGGSGICGGRENQNGRGPAALRPGRCSPVSGAWGRGCPRPDSPGCSCPRPGGWPAAPSGPAAPCPPGGRTAPGPG